MHVCTPAQSAPCLFPAQVGVLSISERLLELSPGLNALGPIPFPSGCQHILQSGLKSSHTRTIVSLTVLVLPDCPNHEPCVATVLAPDT